MNITVSRAIVRRARPDVRGVAPATRSVAARPSRMLFVVALALAALALSAAAAAAKPIPGQYIVTVREGHDPSAVAERLEARPTHVYRSALNGFAARLNEDQLRALREDPYVQLVEQDVEGSAAATQAMDAAGNPWGLDRIDQAFLPLSKTYSYTKDGIDPGGSAVRVYVLDTGLQTNHPEFGGRALNVHNATTGGDTDCHGHGTHVAGTAGASTFGVAKKVQLRGVKVVASPDCSGTAAASDVIAGIDWVKDSYIPPAVANISIQFPKVVAMNTAVSNLVAAGVFVAVAAGNTNVDACTQSPASAATAFTTAASTKTDARWTSSNKGNCVDGYAPGDAIKSSTLGGGSGLMSGTSMATPHVAGTGALLCSYGPSYCTASYIANWITAGSTTGVITGNPAGTPNRLLHKGTL